MNADDVDWNNEIEGQEFLSSLKMYKRGYWIANAILIISLALLGVWFVVVQPTDPRLIAGGQAAFFLAFGGGFLMIGVMTTLASWRMSAEQYGEFIRFIALRGRGLPKILPLSYWLWQHRILGPVCIVVGLIPIVLGILLLVEFATVGN